MNSWNPQQQNNMVVGQAQFNPYGNWSYPTAQPRVFNTSLPTYKAEPIHGKDAAWQFPMGPNSEIYLPDADNDIIWWIRTDANGNKNVLPFDALPHQEPEQVDINNILARLSAVEEKLNGKQNKSNAKRSQPVPATATVATVDEPVN